MGYEVSAVAYRALEVTSEETGQSEVLYRAWFFVVDEDGDEHRVVVEDI